MSIRLTIGKKMIGAFSLILVLLLAVAIVGFNSLGKVVEKFNKADDANRLIEQMYHSRQQEKNFMLRGDDEYTQLVNKQVEQIKREAERIKSSESDQAFSSRVDDLLEAVNTYEKAFNDYVDLERQVRDSDIEMVKSARQLEAVVQTILQKNKTEYLKLMDMGAGKSQTGILMENMEDAETILRSVLQCRRHEKNYLIRKEEKYFHRINTFVDQIVSLAEAMAGRSKTENEREKTDKIIVLAETYRRILTGMDGQSRQIIEASQKYREAFVGIKKLKDAQRESEEGMVDAARAAQTVCDGARTYQKKEMDAQIVKVKKFMILTTILAFVIGMGMALFITRGITTPLRRIIDDIARGDLTSQIEVKSRDEVGELASGFNQLVAKFRGIIQEISENSRVVGALSHELSGVSVQMSSGADRTAAQAGNVTEAAEEMSENLSGVASAMAQSSTNVGIVASAAEEMTSTISEIARRAEDAQKISQEAVAHADESSERIAELRQAAKAISLVTQTITDISEQINLLALNALIEAARAGNAGKGFAVVADEVKMLARETAEATMDIAGQNKKIQETTELSIRDITKISTVINGVNDTITAIAAAVEEQSATTKEIADNIVQVSVGIEDVNRHTNRNSSAAGKVSRDIAEVNTMAREISDSSSLIESSAGQLQKMVAQFNTIVGEFKI